MSVCSRGSIPNRSTGRCKQCTSFTVPELKAMSRSLGLSTQYASKEMLCRQLLRHFGYRSKSVSRSSSAKARKSAAKPRKSAAKPRKSAAKPLKSAARKVAKRRSTSTRRKVSSYSKPRTSIASRRSRLPRYVVTGYRGRPVVRSRYSYPSTGTGSVQKRHHSSKRQGPSLPAQMHCGETARGNDGNYWQSRRDASGACRWRRL